MSEAIYDEQIAPALLELLKICAANGMQMIASVEYEPGESGTSIQFDGKQSLPMDLGRAALMSHGNVDSLFMSIIRHAREHGHSSFYLHQLGVPMTPEAKATGE